jgi:hypothetical protein
MKARWKIALGLIALACIGALFYFAGGSPDERELEATRRSLHQQGFKVDLTEFNFSISSEARQRAAALATTTMAEIKNRSRPGPVLTDVPRLMTAASPDAVIVIWRLEQLKHGRFLDFWPLLRETFETNRARLDAACEAACSGPIQFEPIGTGASALLPYLADLKSLQIAFGFRAMLALHDRQPDAWTNILASTCLVTSYTPEPHEIAHMVRIACVSVAFETLWNALQTRQWSDAQLSELQRRWELLDFWNGLPDTVACSRATLVDALNRERRQPVSANISLKFAVQSPMGEWRSLTDWWRRIRYRHHGIYEAERAALLFYRHRELEVRHAIQCPNWEQMRQLPGVTNNVPFIPNGPSQSLLMWNTRQMSLSWQGEGQTLLARTAEAEARRRLIITALALERYHVANGSYPATLQALVPKLLTSVPLDFMDSKPLRYRRTEDGHFVLYSVGLDCVDDGGQLRRPVADAELNNPLPFAFRRQRDIVWPRPASAIEVEKFLQEELEAAKAQFTLAEDTATTQQWKRSDRRQAKVETILKQQPPTYEPMWRGRTLAQALQNELQPGTNQPSFSDTLTLRQFITGAEPEVVTFELPIKYKALTNIGELFLLVDPCEDDDSDEGCIAGLMECKPNTNGNCLLVWNTIYETPGKHAIQAAVSLNDAKSPFHLVEGPVAPFAITNLCQFSLTSARFQREYGVTLRARLPEPDGLYKFEITSVAGELIKTISGSTSNSLVNVHWALLDVARLRIHAKNSVHSRSAAAVAVGPRLVRPSDLESEAVGAGSELRTRGLGERLGLQ